MCNCFRISRNLPNCLSLLAFLNLCGKGRGGTSGTCLGNVGSSKIIGELTEELAGEFFFIFIPCSNFFFRHFGFGLVHRLFIIILCWNFDCIFIPKSYSLGMLFPFPLRNFSNPHKETQKLLIDLELKTQVSLDSFSIQFSIYKRSHLLPLQEKH